MTWFAESPALRRRQMLVDAAVGGWVLVWFWIGRAVYEGVQRLAGPGVELEQAGRGLAGGLSGAAEKAGRLPAVGDGLRAPLDAAAGAGEALAGAGLAQQEAVSTLALVLALAIGGFPIAWAVLRWLPGRLRWSREHAAAGRLRDDVDLLALRAAVNAPLHELAALGPDPVSRWRAGDEDAGRSLAALELRRLGLQVPAGP